MAVPAERIRAANAAPVRPGRALVVYWMSASRRVRFNPALERAVALARELSRPLVVLETLRADEPHASDRLHAFAIQGMADTARRLAGRAAYHPYVEPARGAGDGLVEPERLEHDERPPQLGRDRHRPLQRRVEADAPARRRPVEDELAPGAERGGVRGADPLGGDGHGPPRHAWFRSMSSFGSGSR